MIRIEKEIIKEVKEVKITFQAEDGTIFDDEIKCREYEKSYFFKIKTTFNEIPHTITNGVLFEYGVEEDIVYVMIPRDLKDIESINDVLIYTDKNNLQLFNQDDIGKMCFINFGNEGVGGCFYEIFRKDAYLKNVNQQFFKYRNEIASKYSRNDELSKDELYNNVLDELERVKELLLEKADFNTLFDLLEQTKKALLKNDELKERAEENMLLEDMEMSIERISDYISA